MQQDWKATSGYGTVGLELVLSILFGAYGGHWLDRKLGTGPWLLIVGFVAGVVAGFRAVWRALRRANREAEEDERRAQQARKKYHESSKSQRR